MRNHVLGSRVITHQEAVYGEENEKVKMKTEKWKIQPSPLECVSRAAAFPVIDLFFPPLQRVAYRVDPKPRTSHHTPRP